MPSIIRPPRHSGSRSLEPPDARYMTETCALIALAAHSDPGASFAARPSTKYRSHGANARSVENAAMVCR
jgi:hypothetical protein